MDDNKYLEIEQTDIKNVGIWEKLLICQEKISIAKNNYNKFGEYNYRDISDILFELKPLLKLTRLFLYFTSPTVIEERKIIKIGMVIRDVDSNDIVTDEIEMYYDTNKKKMDLSQIEISSITYAKKTLLSNWFLCESEEPDSHDNTNINNTGSKQSNTGYKNPNNETKSTTNTELTKEDKENIELAYYLITGLAKKSNKNYEDVLQELTSFIGKDKKRVAGVKDIKKLSPNRLNYLMKTLRTKYPKEILDTSTWIDNKKSNPQNNTQNPQNSTQDNKNNTQKG